MLNHEGENRAMRKILGKRRRDEKGFALAWVGFGFLALFSASMLAVDVGMLMVARTQAQSAADAGALAGATALLYDSFTDHSASGPAVSGAMNTGKSNRIIAQPPSILSTDVSFLADPTTGEMDRVKVWAHRTAARGNPVPTLIARFFGMATVDIVATATADAFPANTETCVMPFTIPDKWIENVDGQCKPDGPWTTSSGFDLYSTKGNSQNSGYACSNPDVYIPPGQSGSTGYSPVFDKGLEIILKNNNQNKVAPSMYNPWDMPGSSGGNDYSNNIANCNTATVQIGNMLTPETGNMTGPTSQGTNELIAKDPNAYWDTGCNCVKGSAFGVSPRIAVVPTYNPVVYAQGEQSGKSQPQLQVTNYLGFFVEGVDGSGNVTGRITPIAGLYKANAGPAPVGAFARVIRLVQ
jgi:hypothetical protein